MHRYQESMAATEIGISVEEDRGILISQLYLWISLLLNVITWISTKPHIYIRQPRVKYWSLRF